MRRLIAVTIIFALVIATGICGITVISNTVKKVEQLIEQIQKNAFTDTKGKAEDFFYFWQDKKEILAIFVNHGALDEIGKLSARMVSAERAKNSIDLFESANEILFIVRGLKEDEQFSLFTLL